jgi:hypothetical protein
MDLALASSSSRTAPRHLWIVGGLALLWNAFGAFDYLMTVSENEAYLSRFTPEQLAYFTAFPTWAVAFWAVAIWASVLGSAALLLRSRWAVWLFGAALVGMAVTAVYSYVLSDGAAIMGGVGMWLFTAAIWGVAIGLFLYARAQARRGVLR